MKPEMAANREKRERERDPVPGVNGRVECRGGQPETVRLACLVK